MTDIFNSKKAPEPLAPVNAQEAAARSDNARRERLAKGGSYATLFGSAPAIAPAPPKSTLFGA